MCRKFPGYRGVVVLAAVAASAAGATTTLGAGASASTVVWAVGDGPGPKNTNAASVAAMISADKPDALLYLGDVYEAGTDQQYADYYDPTFGVMKSITYPTPGNHEWPNRGSGYFPYWSMLIGDASYYSFDLGGWHFVSLNSQIDTSEGSPQRRWLQDDLAKRKDDCTVVFLHRPRYSAGSHGDAPEEAPLWSAFGDKVAFTLAGHDHDYQRIYGSDGSMNFVVGTGGRGHYPVSASYPGLAFHDANEYGALRIELDARRAAYRFETVGGSTPDFGSVECGTVPGEEVAEGLAVSRTERLDDVLHAGIPMTITGPPGRYRIRAHMNRSATKRLGLGRGRFRRTVVVRRIVDVGASESSAVSAVLAKTVRQALAATRPRAVDVLIELTHIRDSGEKVVLKRRATIEA